jgi:signal transduction histidine kinase
MTLAGIRDALFQHEAESDKDFTAKLDQQSHAGLRTAGLVFPAIVVFMAGSIYLAGRASVSFTAILPAAAILVVSGLCIALARAHTPWPRLIGISAILIAGACLFLISLLRTETDPAADRYLAGQAGVVLLVALVALPMRPVDTLLLGGSLSFFYVAAARAGTWPLNGLVLVATTMLTLLATALSAVLYRRAWETHRAWSEELRSSKELSRAEIRRFVAQSAATTSRMAAALSHDLNTPVGALKSSIDTLTALASRREGAGAAQLARISALEAQVRRSAGEAASRLQQVVLRLQRVTNLDRAEVQLVDLNGLLQDVVYLFESEIRVRQRHISLEFGQLEPVLCRPQQISAVLTNVLTMIGDVDARPGWTVHVQTRTREREAEIVFRGTGPQLRSAETQAIFEPGFAERSGRVVASSWVLFMARQILRENGGEMRVDKSDPAEHTLVISLPVKQQA